MKFNLGTFLIGLLFLSGCSTMTMVQREQKSNEYVSAGTAMEGRGRFDGALEAYQKGLALDPGNPFAQLGRANIHNIQGEWDLAISEYSALIESHSDFKYVANAYDGIGNIYFKRKKYDDAKEEYQKAIKLKSDYFQPHDGLGNILEMRKDYDGALKEYEIALSISKGDKESIRNLVRLRGIMKEKLRDKKVSDL
jgi:tetratricopeptide (TPR) repeat protein